MANADKLKLRLGPGAWVDADDNLHWSLPDLLEELKVQDTPENRAELIQLIKGLLAKDAPEAKIVIRE